MRNTRIIYYLSTLVMCLIFTFSAVMYFTKYDMVKGFFEHMGFPIWMIYPLAVAKLLGVIAVVTRKSQTLKEWAYAGFFYDAVMATAAHYFAGDGITPPSVVAALAVIVSYMYEKRLYA